MQGVTVYSTEESVGARVAPREVSADPIKNATGKSLNYLSPIRMSYGFS